MYEMLVFGRAVMPLTSDRNGEGSRENVTQSNYAPYCPKEGESCRQTLDPIQISVRVLRPGRPVGRLPSVSAKAVKNITSHRNLTQKPFYSLLYHYELKKKKKSLTVTPYMVEQTYLLGYRVRLRTCSNQSQNYLMFLRSFHHEILFSAV